MMYKKEFKCELLTPTFNYGSDSKKPELRAPSLKGVLRFWWRAIHPNLNVQELQKQEEKLFGGTKEKVKAQFSLRIIDENIKHGSSQPVPHKNRGDKGYFQKTAILEKSSFIIKVQSFDLNAFNSISSLIKLISILGGIGGRTRRGMGSFKITSSSIEVTRNYIDELIGSINPHFEYGNFPSANWPYIKEITIGENPKTVKEISHATHVIKGHNTRTYERFVGDASRDNRLASPVYISFFEGEVKKLYPIITILNTISKRGMLTDQGRELQNQLRQLVIS